MTGEHAGAWDLIQTKLGRKSGENVFIDFLILPRPSAEIVLGKEPV